MTTRGLFTTICLSAVMTSSVMGQPNTNPRAALNERFSRSGLKVGGPFPEVDIYDGRGEPFHTGQFKGSPTVLVTGCLT